MKKIEDKELEKLFSEYYGHTVAGINASDMGYYMHIDIPKSTSGGICMTWKLGEVYDIKLWMGEVTVSIYLTHADLEILKELFKKEK